MSTATAKAIRAHIRALPKGVLFTTQDLRGLGKRSAIDQCLSRSVAKGEIVRWARGVFARAEKVDRVPSAEEIATVKARAFGKQIVKVGNAAELPESSEQANRCANYLVDGRSSSFLFDSNVRIRMHGTARRNLSGPGT
jgi:hypothetical protein